MSDVKRVEISVNDSLLSYLDGQAGYRQISRRDLIEDVLESKVSQPDEWEGDLPEPPAEKTIRVDIQESIWDSIKEAAQTDDGFVRDFAGQLLEHQRNQDQNQNPSMGGFSPDL